MATQLRRKNMHMSENIANWYEEKAKEMGVSQSNLMVMALKYYMDQQQALEFSSTMGGLFEQMQKLVETVKENERVD